jgi:predicted phosphodiesterase
MKNKFKMALGAVALAIFGAFGWYWNKEVRSYDQSIMSFNIDAGTIAAVGDTGEVGPKRDEVKKLLAAECPHIVLGLGDLSYPDGVNSLEEFERDVTDFYENICPKTFAALIVSGNHEGYNSDKSVREWLAGFMFPKKMFGSIVYPNYYYGVIFNNACFLGLESTVYDVKLGDPKIQARMETFANKFLSDKRCDGKKKIAFAHHPIYSSGDHGDATDKDYLSFYNKTLKGRVDYFLAGHDHNLSIEKTEDGTQHAVSGSGAKLRECQSNRPNCISAHGFISIDLNAGMIIKHI